MLAFLPCKVQSFLLIKCTLPIFTDLQKTRKKHKFFFFIPKSKPISVFTWKSYKSAHVKACSTDFILSEKNSTK